jgi:hypothetical protein
MSISNTTEDAILNLVFLAVAWANYADDASSVPQTNIHIGLHTGDPGDGGTMNTTETGYTGYARQNVARSAAGWTLTSGSISPDAIIGFPVGSAAPDTVSHFSSGKTGGGAAAILWSGTVTPNIGTGDGVTPQLLTSSTITLD